MDIKLRDKRTLIVELTSEDMKKYELTCVSMDYGTTETKRAIWEILNTAKHETGFDGCQSPICIRMYPHGDGGCRLTVTKTDRYRNDDNMSYLNETVTTINGQKTAAYEFSTLKELMLACKTAKNIGDKTDSAAYSVKCGNGDKYYLILKCDSPSQYIILSEFGRKCQTRHIEEYLYEYGDCLCKNDAVRILSDLI